MAGVAGWHFVFSAPLRGAGRLQAGKPRLVRSDPALAPMEMAFDHLPNGHAGAGLSQRLQLTVVMTVCVCRAAALQTADVISSLARRRRRLRILSTAPA